MCCQQDCRWCQNWESHSTQTGGMGQQESREKYQILCLRRNMWNSCTGEHLWVLVYSRMRTLTGTLLSWLNLGWEHSQEGSQPVDWGTRTVSFITLYLECCIQCWVLSYKVLINRSELSGDPEAGGELVYLFLNIFITCKLLIESRLILLVQSRNISPFFTTANIISSVLFHKN